MPNDRIRNPGRPSLAARLNAQSRSGEAGNRKTNKVEVQLFKRRIRAGMSKDESRKGLKITKSSADDIVAGRTWSSVLILALMALVLMGNSCQGDSTVVCQGLNYPVCSDVPFDYPCLCLSSPEGTSRDKLERMRHLNDK